MNIQAIILDIEGTITPISFVRDTLFPFARTHLSTYLQSHATDDAIATEIAAIRRIAPEIDPVTALMGWMDQDQKIQPLKTLQGLIWQDGYATGELRGEIYPDVPAVVRAWHTRGLALYIYSSGSVAAQKLLLGHSTAGNLCPLFSGYFDTGVGPKRAPASYRTIADQIGPAQECLFLSDIEAELDAAQEAGFRTGQLVREADGTKPSAKHKNFSDFKKLEEIDFVS